jgi:hypothetical protein
LLKKQPLFCLFFFSWWKYWGLNSGPHPQPFLLFSYFSDRVLCFVHWGQPQTMILLPTNASHTVGIIGMYHHIRPWVLNN